MPRLRAAEHGAHVEGGQVRYVVAVQVRQEHLRRGRVRVGLAEVPMSAAGVYF